jgi:Caspase recruitment domain
VHAACASSPIKPSEAEIPRQEIIWKRQELAEKYMEPKFGLVAELRSNGLLSEPEVEWVDAGRTSTEHNIRIIDFVLQKESTGLYKFLEALIKCDQEHVVNWLLNRTGILILNYVNYITGHLNQMNDLSGTPCMYCRGLGSYSKSI